ncbi:hypothetical protein VP01_2339g1, partial [Puccinia sorghi]
QQQQHSKDVVRQHSRLEVGKHASMNLKKGLFQWTVRESTQQIYNEFITQAKKKYLTENSLNNQVMIFDEHNDNQIVGLFEFIPFSSMTCDELNDPEFLTEFFHGHKSFVNSMNELVFTSLWRRSQKILIDLVLSLPITTFKKNLTLWLNTKCLNSVIQNSTTSEGNTFSAASLVCYTYNGFYNTPHKAKQDSSKSSFGGEFVFPDCKFGLGFEKLDGIARMVWCATEYSHFTTYFQCFQQHQDTASFFDGLNYGDLDQIFNTVEQRKTKKK